MNLDFDETVTGALTFNEDGSGLNDFTMSVDYIFTLPLLDCTLASGNMTCADVNPDEMSSPPNQISFVCIDDSTVEGLVTASVLTSTLMPSNTQWVLKRMLPLLKT